MEVKFEHRLTDVESKIKDHERRINDIDKRQNDLDKLTTAVNVLATREENVEKTVTEIKNDVKDLANKPAKRWDGVVDKAISAIVGGVIAYALFKLGLG